MTVLCWSFDGPAAMKCYLKIQLKNPDSVAVLTNTFIDWGKSSLSSEASHTHKLFVVVAEQSCL
jgi:hypothetical protein